MDANVAHVAAQCGVRSAHRPHLHLPVAAPSVLCFPHRPKRDVVFVERVEAPQAEQDAILMPSEQA